MPRGPTRFPPRRRPPSSRAGPASWRALRRGRTHVGYFVPELCGGLQAEARRGPHLRRGTRAGVRYPARCGRRGFKLRPGRGDWAGLGRWCERSDTPPRWGLGLSGGWRLPGPGWPGVGRAEVGVLTRVQQLGLGRRGVGERDEWHLVRGTSSSATLSGMVVENRHRSPTSPKRGPAGERWGWGGNRSANSIPQTLGVFSWRFTGTITPASARQSHSCLC